MVPDSARRGLLAKLIHKARTLGIGDSKPDVQIALKAKAPKLPNNEKPAGDVVNVAGASQVLGQEEFKPDRRAVAAANKVEAEKQPFLLVNADGTDVDKLFGENNEPSLFERVRARYVALRPQFILVSMNSLEGE